MNGCRVMDSSLELPCQFRYTVEMSMKEFGPMEIISKPGQG